MAISTPKRWKSRPGSPLVRKARSAGPSTASTIGCARPVRPSTRRSRSNFSVSPDPRRRRGCRPISTSASRRFRANVSFEERNMDQVGIRSMQDDDAPVRTTLRDGVGTIELSRPAVFNCLSQRMLSEIGAVIATFERDGARAVLIVASGKNFCTGAALDEVEVVRDGGAELRDFLALGHSVLDRLEA